MKILLLVIINILNDFEHKKKMLRITAEFESWFEDTRHYKFFGPKMMT